MVLIPSPIDVTLRSVVVELGPIDSRICQNYIRRFLRCFVIVNNLECKFYPCQAKIASIHTALSFWQVLHGQTPIELHFEGVLAHDRPYL